MPTPNLESFADAQMRYQSGAMDQANTLTNMRIQEQKMRQAQQQQQEMEQLKPILAQSGGDPQKAIQALLKTGNPTAIALAAKLHSFMPKPAEPYTLTPDAVRMGPNNQEVARGLAKAPPKAQNQSNISRLMDEAGIGPDDPRRATFLANAMRKESETAKQISPTVVMPRQESPPVAIVGPDGKPVLVSRADAIGKTPAKEVMEKALPVALQKQLTDAAELADATSRFKTTFKDDYGGKTITGELGNIKGRYFGDNTGQSQWWQDYELHQSQVRNKLFGSALTAPEIEAWNKSAINPRMDAGQIKSNLSRRDTLEQRAIDRLIKGSTAGRYNKEQIEAFTGRRSDTTNKGTSDYVETRKTKDGRTLGKKADGTIEEIK